MYYVHFEFLVDEFNAEAPVTGAVLAPGWRNLIWSWYFLTSYTWLREKQQNCENVQHSVNWCQITL